MDENSLVSMSVASEMMGPPSEHLQGRPPEQWVSAPELVHLLEVAQRAERICAVVRSRSLSGRSAQPGSLTSSDAAIFMNVRRKNKSLVPRAWLLWWDKRMGKRATIERFLAIAKRWFGLNEFHGAGWLAFLMQTLLTYCAIVSVALVAVRVGHPDWRLSPRRLLAPW